MNAGLKSLGRFGVVFFLSLTTLIAAPWVANAANNASILAGDSSVPGSADPSVTIDVRVRVQNTGDTTWSAGASYRLGAAPANQVGWGGYRCGGYMNSLTDGRVFLCQNVPPGGVHDFQFQIVLPASGTVRLSVRMVRDGVEWFGPIQSWDVSVSGGPQLPDVVVDTVRLEPAQPTAGGVVRFASTVRNQGSAATPSSVVIGVGYLIDGRWVSYGVTSTPLAAGASTTITTQGNPWTAVSGEHELTAVVDDVNRFAESNETNNARSIRFSVGAGSGCPTTPLATPSDRWRLQIFNNRGLTGSPVEERYDAPGAGGFSFDWGSGRASTCTQTDNFGIRFSRRFQIDPSGEYTFTTTTDDGVRLWVDGQLVIDRWIDQAPTSHSGKISLAAGSHDILMDYYENGGGAFAAIRWGRTGGGCPTTPLATPSDRWRLQIFNNRGLTGSPVEERYDAPGTGGFSFDWGSGRASTCTQTDNFGIRFSRRIQIDSSGEYTFTTTTDDGVRLWVDGQLVIDRWIDQAPTSHSGKISLAAGSHDILMDYYENGGGAFAAIRWEAGGNGGGGTSSKLGPHFLATAWGTCSDRLLEPCPGVVKFLLGQGHDRLDDLKGTCPNTQTVLRVFVPNSVRYSLGSEAAARAEADDFWRRLWDGLRNLTPAEKAALDWLEGPNELDNFPDWYHNWDLAVNFGHFWDQLATRMHENGFNPLVGSIAVGNPCLRGECARSDRNYFQPAADVVNARHGQGWRIGWSYHSYSQFLVQNVSDSGEAYWTFRFRRTRDETGLAGIPIVLTEGGQDTDRNNGRLIIGDPRCQGQWGWQCRGTPPDRYMSWLAWLDDRLSEDPEVLGVTLYQAAQAGDWWSFNICDQGLDQRLHDHMTGR